MKMVALIRLAALALALLLLGVGNLAHAAIYYVSPSGSDTNDGTSSDRGWKTIDRVNKVALQPGDSVLLEGGQSLPGNLLVTASGNATAPIIISSYGKGAATIRAGDSFGIRLLNCQYVKVHDLILSGSGVKPNGQTTNKAQGLDIYSTVTKGKPWQSIHVDRLTVSGFREGIVLHTPIGKQDVVGYNDVRITNCSVGQCVWGLYCWARRKRAGRPGTSPSAPVCLPIAISAIAGLRHLLRPGGGSLHGLAHPGLERHQFPGGALHDPSLRPGRKPESVTRRHRRYGVSGMREVRGPVQRVPSHGDQHRR